jgi:hypothetical protein
MCKIDMHVFTCGSAVGSHVLYDMISITCSNALLVY